MARFARQAFLMDGGILSSLSPPGVRKRLVISMISLRRSCSRVGRTIDVGLSGKVRQGRGNLAAVDMTIDSIYAANCCAVMVSVVKGEDCRHPGGTRSE